jgi:uncharacterized membrane protein
MPGSTLDVVMKVLVSTVILIAALFIILSRNYDAKTQHWAYGMVGVIVGFLLKQ